MKVFVPLHGFVQWNGGLDLMRLLTSALNEVSVSRSVEVIFGLPASSTAQRIVSGTLRYWRVLSSRSHLPADGGSESALLRTAIGIIGDREVVVCADSGRGVLDGAKRSNADVIFPTLLPLGQSGPPRVGYLFDFQHRHLPDMFSLRTARNRDRRFARLAKGSDALVVNSRAVASDATRFLGVTENRILSLPFTPYALPHWFDVSPEDAQRRYQIRGSYLLVSNHFWKHKDHATALRGFSLLRSQFGYPDLELVFTGDPIDHRDPGHFGRLTALARHLGIEHCTHFLGLIPKADQLALMRGCSAVLQPTWFEGGPGGGSIYEAVGLGVPSVVSDIPVNREIEAPVTFFRKGDADDLAKKVSLVLEQDASEASPERLFAQGARRLQRLGDVIADFLSEIVRVGRLT